jgi:hypothetical protein
LEPAGSTAPGIRTAPLNVKFDATATDPEGKALGRIHSGHACVADRSDDGVAIRVAEALWFTRRRGGAEVLRADLAAAKGGR